MKSALYSLLFFTLIIVSCNIKSTKKNTGLKDEEVTYLNLGDNSVYLINLKNNIKNKLFTFNETPTSTMYDLGFPVWSTKGDKIAFNAVIDSIYGSYITTLKPKKLHAFGKGI